VRCFWQSGPVRDEGLRAVVGQALEAITDLGAVLDDRGEVLYLNPHGCELLGVSPPDVVGTSFVDHIHPDDLDRAVLTINRMSADALGVPITPAFYRLRRSDGTWCRVELNATTVRQADDSSRLVVLGRYSGDHDLQDRVMELLTGGAPFDEAIALVPEFGLWRHAGIDYAVFFHDDNGNPAAHGSSSLVHLGGLADPQTPWAQVAAKGDQLLVPIDETSPEYSERAAQAGFTHVWGIPVPDPWNGTNAVVAFARSEGGADAEVHGYALEVMAKVLQLILLWRHQVLSLRRAARLDPLTGLMNRAGLWEELERFGPTADDDELLAILYVDLDGFKPVNDSHGHVIGDRVLAQVASRLASVIRPGDLVGRLGGDEFAVVTRGLATPDAADAIAARIVAALGEPVEVDELQITVGASVGIAVVSSAAFDADALVDAADRALYRAKEGGRGRWHRVELA
jgi:diguanylate cyclase (GGDEF)-like protein/PAS domain S-box-containing protein